MTDAFFDIRVGEDIFDSTADVLVNPVNTKGVAGAGLAKQFRERLGQEFHLRYIAECTVGGLEVGRTRLLTDQRVITVNGQERRQHVLLFPTKDHWRNPSELPWIKQGLLSVYDELARHGLSTMSTRIAFPLLGAGLGGLEPQAVFDLIRYFTDFPSEIYLTTAQAARITLRGVTFLA